jgi:hypothetical protein
MAVVISSSYVRSYGRISPRALGLLDSRVDTPVVVVCWLDIIAGDPSAQCTLFVALESPPSIRATARGCSGQCSLLFVVAPVNTDRVLIVVVAGDSSVRSIVLALFTCRRLLRAHSIVVVIFQCCVPLS